MRHVFYTYFNEHKYKISPVGPFCFIKCVCSRIEICCLMSSCIAFCGEVFSKLIYSLCSTVDSGCGFVQSLFKNAILFGRSGASHDPLFLEISDHSCFLVDAGVSVSFVADYFIVTIPMKLERLGIAHVHAFEVLTNSLYLGLCCREVNFIAFFFGS